MVWLSIARATYNIWDPSGLCAPRLLTKAEQRTSRSKIRSKQRTGTETSETWILKYSFKAQRIEMRFELRLCNPLQPKTLEKIEPLTPISQNFENPRKRETLRKARNSRCSVRNLIAYSRNRDRNRNNTAHTKHHRLIEVKGYRVNTEQKDNRRCARLSWTENRTSK